MLRHTAKPRNWVRRFAATRTGVFVTALIATVLCAPVSATVVFPNKPLQSGNALPPNIMFILDNSGSMALVSMPFDVEDPDYEGTDTGAGRAGLRDNPYDRSYFNNTIYYDPTGDDYLPWLTADGRTRLTGGTSVDSVYTSWNMASTADGTRNLVGSSESVFYVPKTGTPAGSTDTNDFDRYKIMNVAGRARVVRGSGDDPRKALVDESWPNQDIARNAWWRRSIVVPSEGAISLTVTIRNGSGGNAQLYVRRESQPTTSQYDESDTGSGNSETVVIDNPQPGIWHIGVYNSHGSQAVNNEDINVAVAGYEVATPTGRSQEAELTNIATWYSYYRTRLKTAKAGSSEAFATLARDFRVGFTTINGRAAGLRDGATPVIPVGTNGGLFESANKTAWFNRLHGAAVADGSTPLRNALNDVGVYYQRADAAGPWGPGAAASQVSCRQSFSILTTDGYWNDNPGPGDVGDADGDGHSVTLADVAMKYYKNDLRPGAGGLKNDVPKSTSEAAGTNWQRMVTFGVSIGLRGTMDQSGTPPAPNAGAWPDPMDRQDAERIDDLWHAAVNTHGKFVAASNPDEFAKGLKKALATIAELPSSSSNVTATGTTLTADTQLFSPQFTTGTWVGKLEARSLPTEALQWTASFPAEGSRRIVTRTNVTGTGTTTGNGALFQWANLNATQKTALGGNTAGPNVLAYIRGNQTNEGDEDTDYRQRSTLLGDIIGSSPVYASESTPKMVYVGANDGMLHGFNASTGVEELAYVPAGIDFAKLSTLPDKSYSHHWFVDGEIAVSTREQTPGKNILVGLLGRGGRSVFALDVSDPSNFGANSAEWEFTDPDLGNAVGTPIIVSLNEKRVDGTNKVGVIIGNGYNSNSGKSAVFVLDIETGGLIKKFVTSVGDTTEAGANGMSGPRVWDANRSGTADYIYAGDLRGNLWKFDISGSSAASWSNPITGGNPLFSTPTGQPITGGLTIGLEPTSNRRWIFFGTGRYLTANDPTNDDQQAWYGIIDDNGGVRVALTDLQSRAIRVGTEAEANERAFEPHSVLPAGKKGWYINLFKETTADATTGSERIVVRPELDGRVMQVSSMVPSSDACTPGGYGYSNAIDPWTGTSTLTAYWDTNGDGVINDSDKTTVDGQKVPIGSKKVDGAPTSGGTVYNPGGISPDAPGGLKGAGGKRCYTTSKGVTECEDWLFGTNPARISWREVVRE